MCGLSSGLLDSHGGVPAKYVLPAHPHFWAAARAGYVLGPILGKGGFCSVRKALHEVTGQAVACKIIEKGKLKVGVEQAEQPDGYLQ